MLYRSVLCVGMTLILSSSEAFAGLAPQSSSVSRGNQTTQTQGILSSEDAPQASDSSLPPPQTFGEWIQTQTKVSTHLFLENISPPGTSRGSVVASPSRQFPNYYFHWVRDAALVMEAVLKLYKVAPESQFRQGLRDHLVEYAYFSRQNQWTPTLSKGLGEPKYNTDGTAFNEPWGRPQNDGPALRALTLTHFALELLEKDKTSEGWIRSILYDGAYPSYNTVIKNDLEFVSNHWQEASFDLWEEVYGFHFYTRMVQRRALLQGAVLADLLNDPEAARWYRLQAGEIGKKLLDHWDPQAGYWVESLDQNGKPMDVQRIDAAILLALVHSFDATEYEDARSPFSYKHERTQASVLKIQQAFETLYSINKVKFADDSEMAPAIGRYPQDVYNGGGLGQKPGGNPWILTTCVFSEYYSELAQAWVRSQSISVGALNRPFLKRLLDKQGLRTRLQAGRKILGGTPEFNILVAGAQQEADRFLRRIQHHVLKQSLEQQGMLSEQLDRDEGTFVGARSLTWSHVSFISAAKARELSSSLTSETDRRSGPSGGAPTKKRTSSRLRSQRRML